MYLVKEFDKSDGCFICYSTFRKKDDATKLINIVIKSQEHVKIVMTQIDCDDSGKIFETILWDSEHEK